MRLSDQEIRLIRELLKQGKITGGPYTLVTDTPAGIAIHPVPRILYLDDCYKYDMSYNSSTIIRRMCDFKEGELEDCFRVRALLTALATGDGAKSHPKHQLMFYLNRLGELKGGYVTDAAPAGMGKIQPYSTIEVSPPRSIGQLGDVILLPSDDDSLGTTVDGDVLRLLNINWFAHFHMTKDLDGAIHFVTDPPPPTRQYYGSYPLDKGDMRCDPDARIITSPIGLESGRWRPVMPASIIFWGPDENRPPDHAHGAEEGDGFFGTTSKQLSIFWNDAWWDVAGPGGGLPSGTIILSDTKGEKTGHTYTSNVTQYTPCRPPSIATASMIPSAGTVAFQINSEGDILAGLGATGVYPYTLYLIPDVYTGQPDNPECGGPWEKHSVPSEVQRFNPGYASTKVWDTDHFVYTGWIANGYNLLGPINTAYKYNVIGDTWVAIDPYPAGGGSSVGGVIADPYEEYFCVYNGFTCYYWDGADWINIAVPGDMVGRAWMTSFSIDGRMYVTCGQGATYLKDCWRLAYDPILEIFTWIQMANFPGVARAYAAAYGNDKNEYGVVGLGYNPDRGGQLQDVYKYDEGTNTWSAMLSIPGIPRSNAAGASIHIYSTVPESAPLTCDSFFIAGDNLAMGARFNDILKETLLAAYKKD